MNTKQPQSILLNLFPNKTVAIIVEIFILLLFGVTAAVAHQYLKMPLQLPGKQGILFMLILTSAALLSNLRAGGSIAAIGASGFTFLFAFSGIDPFKPLLYLVVGLVLDVLLIMWRKFDTPLLLLAFIGAISWAVIPLARIIIVIFTGIPYHSFINGFVFPVSTYLLFGFIAALTAGLSLRKFYK